jgi:hypothetical protein
MQLKKCGACARAILQSTTVCQYCGRRDDDAAAPQAASGSGFADHELALEDYFPQHEQLTLLNDAQLTPTQVEEPSLPELPSSEQVQTLASEKDEALPPSQDEHTSRADDDLSFLKDEQSPMEIASDPRLAPSAIFAGSVEELHEEPVGAQAAPVSVAKPARRGSRTVILGGAAAGILILAILTMRGSASPGTSSAASVATPAAAATSKPAATSRPAAARPQPAAPSAVKPHPVPVSPAQMIPAPTWNRVTDGRWVGRERRSTALELNAINKVPIWMRQVRPILIVRCMSRSTEVFVFTQTAARMEPQDDNHTVRVGLDDGQEIIERWADSMEHDALFAPDGAALAKQLMQARTLRFGFTPHNAEPVTAEFDVTGLADLLAPAASQCGFKK